MAPLPNARMRSAPELEGHRNIEEPVLNAIAAVARIAGPEQHSTGGEPHQLGAGK